MRVSINYERVEELSNLLSLIEPSRILVLEEEFDPQFRALKKLSSTVGRNWASVYALIVSLVSYKLTMKGEEWWDCLASMISNRRRFNPPTRLDDVLEDVLWFLDNCRGSIIARDVKKRRVQTVFKNAKHLLNTLASRPEIIYENAEDIVKSLSRALNVEPWRKTVVFTVKMVYYAVREPGDQRLLDIDIPVPVDVRVACASYSSMIVEAPNYMEIIKNPKPAQEAWSIISKRTGIPTINLDTILWLTGWMPRDLSLDDAREKLRQILLRIVDDRRAFEIARRFYLRKC